MLKKQRHLILSYNKSLEVDGSKISIAPELYHKGLSLLLSFLYYAPQHAGFLSLCFFSPRWSKPVSCSSKTTAIEE